MDDTTNTLAAERAAFEHAWGFGACMAGPKEAAWSGWQARAANAEAKPAPADERDAFKLYWAGVTTDRGAYMSTSTTDLAWGAWQARAAAPAAPAQVPERLTDAFRKRGLIVPSSLDEAIAVSKESTNG